MPAPTDPDRRSSSSPRTTKAGRGFGMPSSGGSRRTIESSTSLPRGGPGCRDAASGRGDQVALAIAEQQMPPSSGRPCSAGSGTCSDGPSCGARRAGKRLPRRRRSRGPPCWETSTTSWVGPDFERRAIPCDHRRPPRRLGNRARADMPSSPSCSRSRMTPRRSCCVTRCTRWAVPLDFYDTPSDVGPELAGRFRAAEPPAGRLPARRPRAEPAR